MATDVVKQIRGKTRRRFSADEKIRIVREELRGEVPITELCRQEGIQPSIYYKWSKAFLDAGKNGLTREPTYLGAHTRSLCSVPLSYPESYAVKSDMDRAK